MIIWDGKPQDANAQLYAAGRYRPTLNELDCIGIVMRTHTAERITFTFGHGYQQYGAKPRFIQNGDVAEGGVGAARFATVVHFSTTSPLEAHSERCEPFSSIFSSFR